MEGRKGRRSTSFVGNIILQSVRIAVLLAKVESFRETSHKGEKEITHFLMSKLFDEKHRDLH
jgi:hypothetical protein